ncbi:MAG: phosphomevalonate kinase, partial [Pseudoclavibacter sp.]|nr:phosphomevalonate kinase [Pseudoclavibacter sp.]
MSGVRTASARAHGKLFLAGEYAVVEPGGSAVVLGLDRGVTVRATAGPCGADGPGGTVRSARYGPEPRRWRGPAAGGPVWEDPQLPRDHVLAALEAVLEEARHRGLERIRADLEIRSDLADADGRKYGLGSSGAVSAAVVRAVGRALGLELDDAAVFRLALLAAVRIEPRASGGDVAAACFGGWIAYRSPDRAALAASRARRGAAETVRAEWPGLRIEPLPAPAGLELLVGWTGSAASTPELVGRVQERVRADPAAHERFLAELGRRRAGLRAARAGGAVAATLAAVRRARRQLAGFGESFGTPVETPALRRLCDAAERAGAAAKPSGAG